LFCKFKNFIERAQLQNLLFNQSALRIKDIPVREAVGVVISNDWLPASIVVKLKLYNKLDDFALAGAVPIVVEN
jgi:hypothetical protein